MRIFKLAQLAVPALMLIVLETGCATVEKYSLTYRLWDNEDLTKFSEPAADVNLALFEVSNRADVLVQYNAITESHKAVQRRSYLLRANLARIMAKKKPIPAEPFSPEEMKSIPVLLSAEVATNRPPEQMAYAVAIDQGRGFKLYRPGQPEETYDLPVYAETSGTPTRVALTPFALAGDTAMVCGVLAVLAFIAWAQAGAPIP